MTRFLRPTLLLLILIGSAQARRTDDLTLPAGFHAEILYRVPKEQGSWISMTADPRGRLIVSDQTGPLYRVTPGRDAVTTTCETLDVPLGQAHGLCWADDALYVTVNGVTSDGHQPGVWRVPFHDDRFGQPQLLVALKDREGRPAAGEHGPHAVHLGPDGKLYVIAGNATAVPENRSPGSPARNWDEDILLPRITDHLDPTVLAPGGWLARCDPGDGKNLTLICTGLRNGYDFGFSDEGEPLTFDSDMEWDVGTPWYRPTRITHLVSGGEYGWRNGSAKWPADYPDSLPAVLDVGFASPTGITFGRGLKFPTRYQNAMFLADWAYGRIYAATLTPAGASYRATTEIFAAQRPFQVTAIVANAVDGALYAITGGRGTESQLLRFTYAGDESTAAPRPGADPSANAARELRRKLEAFHAHRNSAAVDVAWPHLGDDDPFIRFAARVAIESQDPATWRDRALREPQVKIAIPALIALARTNDRSLQSQVLDALSRLRLGELPEPRAIDALRAYALCFIRMGRPDAATRQHLVARLDALYPSPSPRINRELCPILAYLDSPSLIGKTLESMRHVDSSDALGFALALRKVKIGWTIDQRRAYFQWLNDAASGKVTGGISLSLFLREIRQDAVATLTPQEKATLGTLIEEPRPQPAPLSAATPRNLVRHWTTAELVPHAAESLEGRSFASGKAAFESASCLRCHRFGEEGENVGPSLTVVGNRFSAADLLEAILSPSRTIADQYAATDLILAGGRVVSGRIVREDATRVTLAESPFWPQATVKVAKRDIRTHRLSPVSPMPAGLLDGLTREQIMDLTAYLRSAGNPQDEAFLPTNP